jgi:hypothetical protein
LLGGRAQARHNNNRSEKQNFFYCCCENLIMGGSPVIHLHVNNALKSSLVFCCNSEISSPTTRLLVCTINQAILYSYSLRRAAAPPHHIK